jgi:putative DNA primase/helicase
VSVPKDTEINTDEAVREAMQRQIRVDIGLLNSSSTPEQIGAIIDHIGSAGLDDVTGDSLLTTIKAQTRTPIGPLRSQLKDVIKNRRKKARAARPAVPGLILDRFGEPLALEANAINVIRQKLPRLFALDEFRQKPMVMREPPWTRPGETYPRPMTNADDAATLAWVQCQGIHIRGRPAIRTAMAEIIRDHVFHPVRDYLNSLEWDGQPRLDRWLIAYLGAKDVPNYTTVVGPKWMISAVARVFMPGCIAKYVLLLVGPQDLGKSTALEVLGGEFYTDDISELGTKDAAMQNAGVWIVELAELASTQKARIEAVKAFISRKVDRFRPPYGTHVTERRRESVLAGTVNPSEAFLKDDSGNVRFWSVPCTKVDLDALRRDRDQLWAEAVHRFRTGVHWWLEDDSAIAAAREQQAEHSELIEDHPWFSTIEDWLRDKERVTIPGRLRQTDKTFVFTMAELLKDALEIPDERHGDHRTTSTVGKILRRLGWKSGGVRLASDTSSKPVRRWQKV